MNKERKNKFQLHLKQDALRFSHRVKPIARVSGSKFEVSKHSQSQKQETVSPTLSTHHPHILTHYLTFVGVHSDNMERVVILQMCKASKAVCALFLCRKVLSLSLLLFPWQPPSLSSRISQCHILWESLPDTFYNTQVCVIKLIFQNVNQLWPLWKIVQRIFKK